MAIDPEDADAYNNMGNAYYGLGNYSEQRNCYKKAARLGNTNSQEWLRENGYSW
ncbi:MAG: tetratricopeptide repeat protein [Prevotellaceae bacterium]|nr:tetratricopeptide repeat protein [Prevotellaceae bacterium]